jgi:hypothetical protein
MAALSSAAVLFCDYAIMFARKGLTKREQKGNIPANAGLVLRSGIRPRRLVECFQPRRICILHNFPGDQV